MNRIILLAQAFIVQKCKSFTFLWNKSRKRQFGNAKL